MILNLMLPSRIERRPESYTIIDEEYAVNVDWIEKGSRYGRGFTYVAIIQEKNIPKNVKEFLKDDDSSFIMKNSQFYGLHLKANIYRKMNPHFKVPSRSKWYDNTPAIAEI